MWPVKLSISERRIHWKLQFLNNHINDHPKLIISTFVPDKHKEGGSYTVQSGNLAKINMLDRWIQLQDSTKISMDNIITIECDLFKNLSEL